MGKYKKPTHKKKEFVRNDNNNAICYYRYSSDAQRDASIEQQRELAVSYAESRGLHIIKEYEDRAISGTTDEREGFQDMLYEVKYLKPAYLILYKTDRLSRDRYDLLDARQRLKSAGCDIVYTAEAMPEDEADKVLVESIYDAFAEHYVINLRRNVERGIRYNAIHCYYNGRKILGYKGKPNSRYEIDPDTEPIVKRIYNEYANGVPMKQIVDELNNAGLRTTRGKEFTINSLRHILQNRAYLGEYRYRDEYFKDGMPRIIDDDLFEKVQKKLGVNKHGGNRRALKMHPESVIDHNDFWLTDHVRCGCCDGLVHGSSGTSGKGRIHYYYVCNNISKKKDRCHLKYIRQEDLEGLVDSYLDDVIHEPTLRLYLARMCYEHYKASNKDNSLYIESIKNKIRDVERKLGNIMKAVEDGIYNDTTADRMKELETQKSFLKDELALEQNKSECELTESQILKFLDTVVNMKDLSNRRRLLDEFIDKIYVYDDRVVINCFYTDDKREIRFDDYKEHIYNMMYIDSLLDQPKSIEDAPVGMLESIIGADDDDFFPHAVL